MKLTRITRYTKTNETVDISIKVLAEGLCTVRLQSMQYIIYKCIIIHRMGKDPKD